MIRNCELLAFGFIVALFGAGCSAPDDHAPPILAPTDVQVLTVPRVATACENHEQGCPCDDPGEVIDCGRVNRVVGDYVWCSTGMQTCDAFGTWGQCQGDALAAPP